MEIDNHFTNIKVEDISKLLKKKFALEKMDRFFSVNGNYSHTSQILNLNAHNSVLLEFRTFSAEETYRLLLILTLHNESAFDHNILNEIRETKDEYNIDKIILWTQGELSVAILQSLKILNVDVIRIGKREIEDISHISNFYLIENAEYTEVVSLNILTDLLIKRLKKMFHLVLSEIAAPSYDNSYGKDKIATQAIMDFEEEKLEALISWLKHEENLNQGATIQNSENNQVIKNSIAIDVGCGTGRHTFKLSESFEKVYAFDFSPKMIDVAKLGKKKRDISKISFSVSDLEYEELPNEDKFQGKANLVVASFGMGSFIEDTSKMLRRFYEWLKPDGRLFISFYNSSSILLKATPNWRDTSLSAMIDIENDTLEVHLPDEIVFRIFCKPFDEHTKRAIGDIFDLTRIYTYPTTMALLPNSFLENGLIKDMFSDIDMNLSQNKKFQNGHYVVIVAQKKNLHSDRVSLFSNIINILTKINANYEIIEHKMVLSIEDVIKQIGYYPNSMIKTIVLKLVKENNFVTVATLSEKKVDVSKIAFFLQTGRDNIKFASQSDMLSIGFPPGSVSPFGMEEQEKVRHLIDQEILDVSSESLFMGVGDNRKTLKLTKSDFNKVTSDFAKIEV
jgi:SAM-dependent methyltransferase